MKRGPWPHLGPQPGDIAHQAGQYTITRASFKNSPRVQIKSSLKSELSFISAFIQGLKIQMETLQSCAFRIEEKVKIC